jgi:hypothetical protein
MLKNFPKEVEGVSVDTLAEVPTFNMMKMLRKIHDSIIWSKMNTWK